MATSIFFNGRLISVPGSYSEVDASGLEPIGLGAAGIIAVLGTAVGGRPVTALEKLDDTIRINKPEQGRRIFKSGDLRESIDMLFNPARDPAVPGGAVQVVAMKVNPATKSTVTLNNSAGAAIDLESADWGSFTEQINVTIQDGTTQGKLLTIAFEDQIETVDDLGGDVIFNLTYVEPISTHPWYTFDAINAEVLASGSIETSGYHYGNGLFSDLTADLISDGPVRVKSSNAGDTNTVYVYGIDASGNPQVEELTLNGTADVDGTLVFQAGGVWGARIVGTTVGTVTLSDQVTPSTIMTFAPGANQTKGLFGYFGLWVANTTIELVCDQAESGFVVIEGKSPSGATQYEKVQLNGLTPVNTTQSWSEITWLATGNADNASGIILNIVSVKTDPAIHDTMQKVADYFNARQLVQTTVRGYVLTLAEGQEFFSPADLDTAGPVDIYDPANPGFTADQAAIIDWINTNSQLVTATLAAGATGGAPDNTTAPVFLQGGSEGVATAVEYQAALDWLKRLRINTIVPLTGDPAIHAQVEAHCAYMGGIGRSERDAVVGLQNAGLSDVPTKTEAKTQIVDLNSRHIRAVAQAVERFNTNGQRQEFQPPFLACVVAGMQAGSDVGEPLTYKFTNTLSFRQDNSWSPVDDAEELVQAGLLFLENVEGVGRRVVRNITTHRTSNNLAFIEGSVNEAVNFAVYNFRTNLEFAVGQKGFSGTINAAKSVALNTLGLLVDAQVLVAYRSLTAELIVDTLEVEAEIAPVLPINFIKNTLHLVTIRQSAA